MRVDDVGALPRRQLLPAPPVIQCPRTRVEFGDQLGDRPGSVRGDVVPRVVDLQEDPLRPLVELHVGGGEAAPRVVAEPEPRQLAAEVDDVGLGARARMRAGLDRVLFGGQSERVEAQRVQHITPRHPEVTRIDIGRDVAQRVTDVQALAGRVGEHVLNEHLVVRHLAAIRRRQRPHRVGHVERARLGPVLLPAALDLACELRRVAELGVSASVTPTG